MERRRAVVLFSGGLDSTTTLLLARAEGLAPRALVFRYGQRHEVEVERALTLARELDVPAQVEELDLRAVGGSALTSDTFEVPRGRDAGAIAGGRVPPTYVPARNTIFLAHALAWAEVEDAGEIWCGMNAVDYSGYPDCRPEFVEAFERLANLACRRSVEDGRRIRIHAPLLHLSKAEIIRKGLELGVEHSRTWSCYAPVRVPGVEGLDGWLACGECDSCRLRREGFRKAEVPDPTHYAGGT